MLATGYRGVRLTALDALARIVGDTAGALSFFAEQDGLTVRGAGDEVVELFQLKQPSAALTVEDLLPSSTAFFRRALALPARPRITVVTVRALGPELQRGFVAAGPERQPIGWKLRDAGFQPDEQARLFAEVRFVEEDPELLERSLQAGLAETIGEDSARDAVELLVWWFARAIHTREPLSHGALVDRLGAIQHYLAARAAGTLSGDRLLPVGDRPGAIDPARLEELTRALESHRLAVLHGGGDRDRAAHRWLHEQVPAAFRFELRGLPDSRATDELATRLSAEAEAVGLPLHLLLPVSARDRAWPTVARRICAHPGLRLLVTLDDESWLKAEIEGPPPPFTALAFTVDAEAHPFATASLAEVAEPDLEPFLLRVFSRRPDEVERVLEALDRRELRTWPGLAGVTRALLWLGVRDHVDANRALIEETRQRFGNTWSLVLDTDLAQTGLGAGWLDDPGLTNESRVLITALRARQTGRGEVFTRARAWLSRERKLDSPQTPAEWVSLGEAQFWIARLQPTSPLRWFDEPRLAAAAAQLPIEELGELMLGLAAAPGLPAFRDAHRAQLLERFLVETRTLTVDDDGQTLCARFLAESTDAADAAEAADAALRRVWLLRKLFDDRQAHGAPDPIARDRLPPPWLSSLNARFVQLAELAFRQSSLRAYVDGTLALRQAAHARVEELVRALSIYFRKQKGVLLPGTHLDLEIWERCSLELGRPTLLPIAAVDEWGATAEESPVMRWPEGLRPRLRQAHALALEGLRGHLDSSTALWQSLAAFLRQSVPLMAVGSQAKSRSAEAVRRIAADAGIAPDAAAQSVRLLADALRILPRYQAEHRRHFGSLVSDAELSLLERRERDALGRAFSLWHRFALHPGQTLPDPETAAAEGLPHALKAARDALRRQLRKLSKESIAAALLPGEPTFDGEPAHFITFDVLTPAQLYSAYLSLHKALRAALKEIAAGELMRHAFRLAGERLVVVGLIRGRSLQQTAWVTTFAALAGEAPGPERLWLSELQRAVTDEDWRSAGLAKWDQPRLAWADRVQSAARALYEAVAQVAELGRNLPAAGRASPVAAQRIAALLSRMTRETATILQFLESIPPEARAGRVALVAAVSRLADFYQNSIAPLLPSDDSDPTIEDLQEWALQLERTLGETEIFRLLWAADVLGISVSG